MTIASIDRLDPVTDLLLEATSELAELRDELRLGEVVDDADELPLWLMSVRSLIDEVGGHLCDLEDGLATDAFPSS